MNAILEVVDTMKPRAVRVFGNGAIELVGQSHRLVGFTPAQFGVALVARGYVESQIGQGYCTMSVYHAPEAA